MISKTNYHLGIFDSEQEAELEYRRALIHLERNYDSLDNYDFNKAPIKHKLFLNKIYKDYIRCTL